MFTHLPLLSWTALWLAGFGASFLHDWSYVCMYMCVTNSTCCICVKWVCLCAVCGVSAVHLVSKFQISTFKSGHANNYHIYHLIFIFMFNTWHVKTWMSHVVSVTTCPQWAVLEALVLNVHQADVWSVKGVTGCKCLSGRRPWNKQPDLKLCSDTDIGIHLIMPNFHTCDKILLSLKSRNLHTIIL